MTISEQSRHRLHTRVADVLGDEEGAVLMEHLPPAGWADVATKTDLNHLAAITKADIENLRIETEAGIERLGTELRGEMADLRSELVSKMSELSRHLVIAMIATNCAMIGAVAAMLSYAR